MSEHPNQLKASRLIELLKQNNMLSDEDRITSSLESLSDKERTSVFIHILIALGTLLTTIFFMSFLYLAEILDFRNHAKSVFTGLLFGAAAIGLLNVSNKQEGAAQSYSLQLAFALMAIGKLLVVIGIVGMTENIWHIPLTFLVLAIPTYFLFPMSLERYLSVTSVLLSALVVLMLDKDLKLGIFYVFNAIFLIELLITAYLVTRPFQRLIQPLLYAFLTSLLCMTIYLTTQGLIIQELSTGFVPLPWTNIMLSLALIALIIYAAKESGNINPEVIIVSVLGSIALTAISAPGIIISVSFLILGYLRSDRVLLVISALAIPCFLIQYYYNLNISLLHKSGILVASGACLLLGYGYIYFRGWIKGEAR